MNTELNAVSQSNDTSELRVALLEKSIDDLNAGQIQCDQAIQSVSAELQIERQRRSN